MSLEDRMEKIFREACNIDEMTEINGEMTSNDIEGWDSLANIHLVSELEAEFKIEFEFDELLELENWNDFKKIVRKKTEKN